MADPTYVLKVKVNLL